MEKISITVAAQASYNVDDRLFGQFLERASFGEPGPENAVIPGTRRLQESVLEKLRAMQIPIMRFPGGTDVDFIDWNDLIDNVPGRGAERPEFTTGHSGRTITNRFGYDEFLVLCAELHSEPLLVLNFQDGALKRKPLADAVRHAAGLVAYCNAPLGSALPEGMPDWPAVRAQNGHLAPYRVNYIQIGNETWFIWGQLNELYGSHAAAQAWYLDCLEAYVDAIRAIDPSIQIIVDGQPAKLVPAVHARLGDKVQYVADHFYWPLCYGNVWKDGKEFPVEQLTPEQTWYAWVSTAHVDPATGMVTIFPDTFNEARKCGYQVAETEWNWNGWRGRGNAPPLESGLACGLGVAALLHGLLRQSDVLKIATQSMCVGCGWKGLGSIYYDPTGAVPAYMMPGGQAVMFYNLHHGNALLPVTTQGIERFEQPYHIGWSTTSPEHPVAYLDVLATGSEQAVFVHVINRYFDQDVPVTLDLSAFSSLGNTAVQHEYRGRLNDAPEPGESNEMVSFTDAPIAVTGKRVQVTLPKRSISIIEIPLK